MPALRLCVLGWSLLITAPGLAQVEVNPDVVEAPIAETGVPSKDPLAAWRVGRSVIADGGEVRRLAFAAHGLFVFHSPPASSDVLASFVQWLDGAYQAEAPEPRTADLCQAEGVDPDLIEPALQQLLAQPEWRQHATQLDSLILECHGEKLFWSMLVPPDGGYQAGVPVKPVELPFQP